MDHDLSVTQLEKRQKEILHDVRLALKELKQRRDNDGCWQDPDNIPSDYNKGDSGVIMALESLLCFLLPLAAAKDDAGFQADVFAIFDSVSLAGEIRTALETIRKAGYAFSGEPYIAVEDKNKKAHPFIDTACLSLSVILFANRVLNLPNTPEDEILYRDVFEKAVNVLKGAMIKDDKSPCKGWFVTDYNLPDRQFKYCTWMATDSFSDITSIIDIEKMPYCPKSSFSIKSIALALDSLRDEMHRFYVLAELTDSEREELKDKGAQICVRSNIVREDADDPERFQFNVWILLTLLYLKYGSNNESDDQTKERLLLEAFRYAAGWVRDKEERLISDEVTIQFKTDDFELERRAPIKNNLRDRAALPQWIKALGIALKRYKEWRPVFGEHLSAMVEMARKNKGEGHNVWDDDSKDDVSIYLTERYIEALVKYYEYLGQIIIEKKPIGVGHEVAGVDWQAIADRVAKTAVVIQIGADQADKVVKRLVANEIDAVKPKLVEALIPRVADEISKQLKEKSDEIQKLSDELMQMRDTLSQSKPKTKIITEMAEKTMTKKTEKA